MAKSPVVKIKTPSQLDRIEAKLDEVVSNRPMHLPNGFADEIKVKRILKFIANGEKIMAIKEYQAVFGVGLKEAKDAIEGLR
jgi:ribosomal protein L7/L12